jgi:Holliday junction resolvase RusA-like endonuclease
VISVVVEGKPLSVNAAYRVVRLGRRAGLAKSSEAKTYQARVQLAARRAMRGSKMLSGDLVFTIVAYWPRRNADSDAAVKLTKDALQGIVYENDRIVRRDESERAHDAARPRVEITVRPYP